MTTTAQVKQQNIASIRRMLWAGGLHSKKSIAAELDLSVATCNTLLNEMAGAGEVTAEPHRTGSAGRGGLCYRASEDYASIAAVWVDLAGQDRVFHADALSLTGSVRQTLNVTLPRLGEPELVEHLKQACELVGNVRYIALGVPGTVRSSVVGHCDISELNGTDIAASVEARLHIPIHAENDMHLKARGYCHEVCDPNEVVTLANFPPHVLPGTATVHAGEPIRGAHGLAGMVGFLPYEEAGEPISRERLTELLAPATCRPYIAKGVASICAVIDPDVVVLTGGLLDASCTEWLRAECLKTIPEEFMPALRFEQNLDRYYLAGMHQTALGYLERTL